MHARPTASGVNMDNPELFCCADTYVPPHTIIERVKYKAWEVVVHFISRSPYGGWSAPGKPQTRYLDSAMLARNSLSLKNRKKIKIKCWSVLTVVATLPNAQLRGPFWHPNFLHVKHMSWYTCMIYCVHITRPRERTWAAGFLVSLLSKTLSLLWRKELKISGT